MHLSIFVHLIIYNCENLIILKHKRIIYFARYFHVNFPRNSNREHCVRASSYSF